MAEPVATRATWPTRVRRTIRLTALLHSAALRSAAQYRINIALTVALGIVYQGSGFAFIWIVMYRFPALGGWSFAEVAFLYGLRLTSHAVWQLPLGGLLTVDQIVREGGFDRFLVRPLNPLIQLLTTRTARMGALGDLITGIAILGGAARTAHVDWSPAAVGFCMLAILGGALIEGAVQLGLATLSFRLLDTFHLRTITDDTFSAFGSYPLKIFGAGTEWLLTFVVPIAFVAYLPASVLLAQTDGLSVAPWIAYLSPLIGGVMMCLAYVAWRGQLNHYQSVGH